MKYLYIAIFVLTATPALALTGLEYSRLSMSEERVHYLAGVLDMYEIFGVSSRNGFQQIRCLKNTDITKDGYDSRVLLKIKTTPELLYMPALTSILAVLHEMCPDRRSK